MRKFVTILMALLLAGSMTVSALAAEFSLDEHATIDGMSRSWYQGYAPGVKNRVMTLCLPVRAARCVGSITAALTLEDPNVYLLAAEPQPVTVYPQDGLYPVKLTLMMDRYRQNGDFPATITLRGTDGDGKEIVETMPYVLRIRDGYASHETLEPVISDVTGELNVGSEGSLQLTITNPTTTISMMDGVLTVTDASGEVLMSGSDRFTIPEILPGKSQTLTVPMTVKASAAISQHSFTVTLRYKALGQDGEWTEHITAPVTQEIRLEQGGVRMPTAVAGELANMTLPLMNMGRGELSNVLVKLEMDGVLDAQSVLVGTMAAGETKQAKLTFTPALDSMGTHSGAVTVTCEDAYGNAFSQTLDVSLTVEEPIPEEEAAQKEEKKTSSPWTGVLIGLCVLLAAGLAVQGKLLTDKLHKLEEERL